MVEVPQNRLEELEEFAEKQEGEIDNLEEEFASRLEDVQEKSEGLDEGQMEDFAVRQTRSWILKTASISSEDIQLLTVGGDIANTDNGDVFFGSAIVDEEPENDGVPTKLGSVRVYDEDLIPQFYNAFAEVGNVVSGNFSVSEADVKNQLSVSNVDNTEISVTKPDDRSGLIQEIRDHVPEVSIANIADNLSAETRGEDGDMYTVSSDIRRIEADIHDGYKDVSGGTGIYTVRDETVFDESDIEASPVFDAEEANENATPGMTCWIDPAKMEYGSETVVEMFGTISVGRDGTVQMSVDGMIPIGGERLATEFDGYEKQEQEPDREKIESGNVDRQKIA